MTDRRQKVLVIGLDGATFRLIDPWIAAGDLPNLARIQLDGCRGKLRSTVRPESSVAWTSFATGVNPGKHGVFGFASVQKDYKIKTNTGRSIRAPRFWQHLSRFGRQVGLFNIPMTYPPQPVNGFMISGMLTPSAQSQFTYPPELRDELLGVLDDYVISVDSVGKGKSKFIELLRRCTELRCQGALHLMRSRPWDLFVVVFVALDRTQHFLWSDMDANHPRHCPADGAIFGQAILEQYRQLDAIVGELGRQAGDDAIVVLLSDHGFNGFHKTVNLNAWLRQIGLMHYTVPYLGDHNSWASRLRSNPFLRRVKRRLPFIRDMNLMSSWQQAQFTQRVDRSRTRAFFSQERAIRINLAGRETMGCVQPGREYEELTQQLTQQLLALRDPETGFAPIEAVYRREDLYDGPFLETAPDLIVEPKRADANAANNYVLSPALEETVFYADNPRSGNHDLDGIFMAVGPGIRAGVELNGARIIDVAPTILYAMGLPIPKAMDGRPLVDMFDATFRHILGKVYLSEEASLTAKDKVFSETEEEQVLERLRSLGYLD
jgi:predicted AlkP superfamily phosphohydrolase/phosphomutase